MLDCHHRCSTTLRVVPLPRATRGGGQQNRSRGAPARPSFANHDAKIDSPPAKEGGGAPKGASNQFRAAPANVAACRCPGAEARHADKCAQSAHLSACGARSPSGATPRLSPGLSHPGSAPGHACWDSVPAGVTRPLLSQSSGSTPHLGRSTEENDAQSRSGADCKSARKHRTRSASESALAKASLDERDSADCNENRDKCQQQSRDIKDSHSKSFLPMASDVATDKLS
jgi:hypothetical protein